MGKVLPATLQPERYLLNTYVDLNSKNPWNLPDWRIPEQYPSVESTSDGAWRWEFLRRHRYYRSVWLAYQSNHDAWKKVRSDGETRKKIVARWFNVDKLDSPARRYNQFIVPIGMTTSLYEITPAFHGHMSEFCEWAARKGQYLVALSPNESLTDQLASIEADIIELNKVWQDWSVDQKPPRKPEWTRRNFPLYLRILDALDPTHPEKAGLGSISKVLSTEAHNRCTDKRAVVDIRKSAEEHSEKFLRTMPA
jgi:hypothetical protein